MKRMKRATACLVAASLLFTVLPLSGCFKKKHAPMGTNEVLTDDAPWYNIEKKVLEDIRSFRDGVFLVRLARCIRRQDRNAYGRKLSRSR